MPSYDDGEDIPTPDEDLGEQDRSILDAIRDVDDPKVRRALMILFVIVVLRGRIGRE
jgi:hypothetical protein